VNLLCLSGDGLSASLFAAAQPRLVFDRAPVVEIAPC